MVNQSGLWFQVAVERCWKGSGTELILSGVNLNDSNETGRIHLDNLVRGSQPDNESPVAIHCCCCFNEPCHPFVTETSDVVDDCNMDRICR